MSLAQRLGLRYGVHVTLFIDYDDHSSTQRMFLRAWQSAYWYSALSKDEEPETKLPSLGDSIMQHIAALNPINQA